MIVKYSEIRKYFSDIDDSDEDILGMIHQSVESFVKTYCRRDFDSTSYSKERYNGNGQNYLFLDNFPVTALDRIAVGILDVIKIKNTNSTSTASVSVKSTGLRLVKDGTADETVLFATYTTLSDVVTAINAISGWSAELLNSSYGAYKSTELVVVYGLNAIDNNWIYLSIPDEAEDEVKLNPETGEVLIRNVFTKGFQNVFVDYTAGYTFSNMPEDLKLAVKMLVHYLWERKEEDSFGAKSFDVDRISTEFEKLDIPKEVRMILSKYKRRLV
jgi:hypothetical protein